MERLRTTLKQELGDDAVEQRLLAAIERDYELTEKDPPPIRTFMSSGTTCNVWRRGEMWHIKAGELVMNVEGHWDDSAVDAYAAEQIGLRGARRG